MISFVSNNQHAWIIQCSLDMFPSWASSHATALVVSSVDFREEIEEIRDELMADFMINSKSVGFLRRKWRIKRVILPGMWRSFNGFLAVFSP